jgi:hypothetical protein
MSGNRHKAVLLAVAGLVVAGLAVVTTATPVAAAGYAERWCSTPTKAPCIISATRNGVAMHAGDALEVQLTPTQDLSDFKDIAFQVTDPTDAVHLSTTDNISVLIDLGTLKPEYTEGYASRPDVDRINDGDGTYKVRYTGHPVLLTAGCNDSYPSSCPDTASDQDVKFSAEIEKLKTNHELEGFDRSQRADMVDGIFLQTSRSGDYLESTWDNSRFLTDGVTKAKAEARFRVPYQMLIDEFKIPNPATIVTSSLIGTVNGAPATYSVSQDPKGGGVFFDISGVTFGPGTARVSHPGTAASPSRVIKVRRGTITPFAPTLQKATRVSASKAKLRFLRARARGAKVTGYQARCQSAGHKTLTAKGSYPAVTVGHLKPGRKYQCSVRGLSKVGPGRWSTRIKV